jgi:hypothetical protein
MHPHVGGSMRACPCMAMSNNILICLFRQFLLVY